MKWTRYSSGAAIVAAAFGLGFWTAHGDPERHPTPVDALMTEAAEVVEQAPEAGPEPVTVKSSPVAPSSEVAASEASSSGGSSAGEEAAAGSGEAVAAASTGSAAWDLPVTYNDRVEYWIDFLTGRNKDRTVSYTHLTLPTNREV